MQFMFELYINKVKFYMIIGQKYVLKTNLRDVRQIFQIRIKLTIKNC